MDTGAATCSGCNLGEYGSSKGYCSSCPAGRYQDGKGETSCKACGVDTYTNEPGKSSNADCTSCSADRSTGTVTGNTDESDCLCKRTDYYQNKDNECEPCPLGADCSSKDGVLLSEISALSGYWRPTVTSPIFSPCSKGHRGLNAQAVAKKRCCPIGTANTSICTTIDLSNTTTDAQCLLGYSGPLCLVCANDYVDVGGGCVPCPGGASFLMATIPVTIACAVFFFFVLFFLLWSTSSKNKTTKGIGNENKIKQTNKFIGQAKILLSFIQIFSSMPNVLDSVPWPTIFLEVALPFGIFNFEFLSLFAKTSCGVNVRFFDRFVIHMILPIMVIASILFALVVARRCTANKERLVRANEMTFKITILVILLLFPGLSTKVFQMMKCVSIDGIEGELLVEDYSITCNQGKHVGYTALAGVFLGVYVVGIPLVMFLLLWWNRQHLHNVNSPKHRWMNTALGGLFLQCK